MKVKTSITIEQSVIDRLKQIAEREDRSVSYILEKFIEARVAEDPETSGKIVRPSGTGGGRPVSYSTTRAKEKKQARR